MNVIQVLSGVSIEVGDIKAGWQLRYQYDHTGNPSPGSFTFSYADTCCSNFQLCFLKPALFTTFWNIAGPLICPLLVRRVPAMG